MSIRNNSKLNLLIGLFTTLLVQAFAQDTTSKVIKGTKVSLIPPVNFVEASTFSGFQNEKYGASIMVTQIPASFEQLAGSFTVEALKTRGMTLINKTPIDLQKSTIGKAIFIELSQTAGGTAYMKQTVMFGDENKTIMVNGIYPEINKSLAQEIKAALLTVSYNEGQNDDGLSAVNFTVNTNDTPFKFVKFIGGSLIYTTDGIMGNNNASVVIAPSLQKIPVEHQKEVSANILKNLPHQQSAEIKTIAIVQIGTLTGYEIIANGKNKDDKP
jgi:hypothetical protein